MGQFDNFNQVPAEDHKVTISGLQFHEVHGVDTGSGRPDFSHILSRNGEVAAPTAPAPAAADSQRLAQPSADVQPVAQAAPQARQGGFQLVDGKDDPPPPRPGDEDSPATQLGWYAGLGVSIGASTLAYKAFDKSVRGKELEDLLNLETVTKPETLSLVRQKAEALVNDVAAKSAASKQAVELIAQEKPHAFEQMTESMPAKAAGAPAETLHWKQVKNIADLSEQEHQLMGEGKIARLTEAELDITDRDVYLRNLERSLVKGYDMPHNTRVSAFRQRHHALEGLSEHEAAELEGFAKPLAELEQASKGLMHETVAGKVELAKANGGEIAKAMGVLGASFVGSRLIDQGLYGSKPQGWLTTAGDIASPFLVFTKYSPMLKVGAMIGAHEVLRYIDYKNAQQKNSNSDQ